jgi:mutator protein MutT
VPPAAPLNPGDDPPRTDVAIAIIVRGAKVLVCQRPEGGSFPGYWEFPGGKREPGESVIECLRREAMEELALRVEPVHPLSTIDHDYARGRIRLHPYVCTTDDATPRLLASQDARWIDPRDLKRYRFPPANDTLLDEAIACLTRPEAGVLISERPRATLDVSETGD